MNLSHNLISKVEGLEGCTAIKNLDLSHNYIDKIEDCEGLKALPELTRLDLKNNIIDNKDGEGVLSFLG